MVDTHFQRLSKTSIPIFVAAAALALPHMRVQAQSTALADGSAGYEVGCSIQASSGLRACDETASARSCDAEANDASRPSSELTDIALVNRGGKPVKVYWLNFHGQRVLYKYLPPGGQLTQKTFIGHNWLVATLNEQCVEIFKMGAVAMPPQPIVGDAAVTVAPPAIPVYEQPPPPEDDQVWTPGYWAWNDDVSDYYWVPATWITAPIVGYLWTPGYWALQRGAYAWHAGYWGPHVGFYGGINYGYGYFGRGFVGGSWRDGRMMYNSAVTNVGFKSTNAYNQPVSNASSTRVSYNGGGGGISAQPNAAELAAASEYHIPPTAAQLQQIHTAHGNPAMRAGWNNGHPSIGATSRPGESLAASTPAAQHAGTLSVMHSTSPPPPARGVGTAASARAAPAASTSPGAATQNRPHTPASQPAQVAQTPAEQQSAPQDTQQPHQSPSQTHPKTVPHAAAHPP
jgi:hypothetical protein